MRLIPRATAPHALLLACTLATGLGLAASPALAQSKKDLAARIVQLQGPEYENLGRAVASEPANQAMQLVLRALQGVPADKREAVGKDLQAEVKKFYDSIAPSLAERAGKLAPGVMQPLLEERLSEDEMKAVIAYLESPASKKYQQLMGEAPRSLTEKLVADTRTTVEPKLKQLEQTLQAKLKAATPAAPASAPPAKPAAGSKK